MKALRFVGASALAICRTPVPGSQPDSTASCADGPEQFQCNSVTGWALSASDRRKHPQATAVLKHTVFAGMQTVDEDQLDQVAGYV